MAADLKLDTFVAGTVRGQGSMRIVTTKAGRGFGKYSTPTIEWRNIVVDHLRQVTEGRDEFPLAGPVHVKLVAVLARPKGHFGTGRNADTLKKSAPGWQTKFPDLDKISRLVNDAATVAGIWGDDSQVARMSCKKIYARNQKDLPGLYVRVYTLGEL